MNRSRQAIDSNFQASAPAMYRLTTGSSDDAAECDRAAQYHGTRRVNY
jgi:hypothetical protein